MSIKKFPISRDPQYYLAWPDVALAADGRMVTVFSECNHHGNREYTRIMQCESFDRGCNWTSKHPVTESTVDREYFYNCPRISRLRDGRLALMVDRVPLKDGVRNEEAAVNLLRFSSDHGESWSEPVELPLRGIVPDRLLELDNGRWIISAHRRCGEKLAQFLYYSDDRGASWSDEVVLAKSGRLNLCEVSILPVGEGTLVAFLRENSGLGYDCQKAISRDNGESWSEVIDFPLPGCHRPVARLLRDGRILITYRFMQGGRGWLGYWTQNFFAALTDCESALAPAREGAATRILPIDFDRSALADLGYSGQVEFSAGELYIVSYIVDDAVDKGQIRGYSLNLGDFYLEEQTAVEGVKQ